MSLVKKCAALTALAFGVTVAASAVNAASLPAEHLPGLETSQLLQVQYGPPPGHYDRRPPPPPYYGPPPRRRYHYVPGHRYDAPPPRWHRHHSRPHDWRRRGCVIVGPVWFCP